MRTAIIPYTKPHRFQQLNEVIGLYRPFIIGLLVVSGATCVLYLVHAFQGPVSTYQVMNLFMGCFFIVYAAPKFLHLTAFAEAFRQYDLISQRVHWYARAFPFLELSLGLALLSNVASYSMLAGNIVNGLVAVVSGVGILSVVRSLRLRKDLHCACMGSTFKFPLSKVAVIENGVMFLMAFAMLVLMSSDHMMASLVHASRLS